MRTPRSAALHFLAIAAAVLAPSPMAVKRSSSMADLRAAERWKAFKVSKIGSKVGWGWLDMLAHINLNLLDRGFCALSCARRIRENLCLVRRQSQVKDRFSRRFFLFRAGAVRSDKDFAAAHFDGIGFDLALGRASDHMAGANVELRAVPGTLHGAAHQSAVGQWPASVRAMIAEGKHSFRTPPHHHLQAPYLRYGHLSIGQFALVADGLVPACQGALAPLPGIGVTVVHANLVAIDQGAAQPTGG